MRKSENVQGNEIEITESTQARFQQFLEFIYTDKLGVDVAGALDLLQLAQKYKIRPLSRKCEQLLQAEIPIVDSVKAFEAARRRGRQELMDRASEIMVKSFLHLKSTDTLVDAEEETLICILEFDGLNVKEVELFEFVLEWGRHQVGTSDGKELLRNKLKNLISKIRYTNMTPHEFTEVVVPTGLLSPEETVSVFSYFCGDDPIRIRIGLDIKFNTTRRKVDERQKLTMTGDFYDGQHRNLAYFPVFSKQSISFRAEKRAVARKIWADQSLKKPVITGVILQWPLLNLDYQKDVALNFHVSIREYSGSLEDDNFTTRCQNELFNCSHGCSDLVSVEPPVELISGRVYSVVVEDNTTTVDGHCSFKNDARAYHGFWYRDIHRQAAVIFDDVHLTLKGIHSNTDYCEDLPLRRRYEEIAVIRGFNIGMV